MKKIKYFKNTIILSTGSLINIYSIKKKKQIKLIKDNYNKLYLSSFNNTSIIDSSKETKLYSFIKKFKKY